MELFKKDKKNLLVIPTNVLTSKISKEESEKSSLYYSFYHTGKNHFSLDRYSLGFKHVKVLDEIVKKTKCSLLIIDNIVHYDFLKVILKNRGLKNANKIIDIIDGDGLYSNCFREYKKSFNLLFVTTKKIYDKSPHLKVKADAGLTLNEEIKIVSYFKQQPYKWSAARSIKSEIEIDKLFEDHGHVDRSDCSPVYSLKYCWV